MTREEIIRRIWEAIEHLDENDVADVINTYEEDRLRETVHVES